MLREQGLLNDKLIYYFVPYMVKYKETKFMKNL